MHGKDLHFFFNNDCIGIIILVFHKWKKCTIFMLSNYYKSKTHTSAHWVSAKPAFWLSFELCIVENGYSSMSHNHNNLFGDQSRLSLGVRYSLGLIGTLSQVLHDMADDPSPALGPCCGTCCQKTCAWRTHWILLNHTSKHIILNLHITCIITRSITPCLLPC